MRINIKERLKNKTFVLIAITLFITFVYQLLALLGITPAVSENEVVELVSMAINILAFLGVLVDPTTEGLSDSERALTYGTEKDVRLIETYVDCDKDSCVTEKRDE